MVEEESAKREVLRDTHRPNRWSWGGAAHRVSYRYFIWEISWQKKGPLSLQAHLLLLASKQIKHLLNVWGREELWGG